MNLIGYTPGIIAGDANHHFPEASDDMPGQVGASSIPPHFRHFSEGTLSRKSDIVLVKNALGLNMPEQVALAQSENDRLVPTKAVLPKRTDKENEIFPIRELGTFNLVLNTRFQASMSKLLKDSADNIDSQNALKDVVDTINQAVKDGRVTNDGRDSLTGIIKKTTEDLKTAKDAEGRNKIIAQLIETIAPIINSTKEIAKDVGILAGGIVGLMGTGAGIGALVGTFAFPGLGTAVGAVIGSLLGAGAGFAVTGLQGLIRGRLTGGQNPTGERVAAGFLTTLGTTGIGALIGTILLPGVGTAIGALIGLGIGVTFAAATAWMFDSTPQTTSQNQQPVITTNLYGNDKLKKTSVEDLPTESKENVNAGTPTQNLIGTEAAPPALELASNSTGDKTTGDKTTGDKTTENAKKNIQDLRAESFEENKVGSGACQGK